MSILLPETAVPSIEVSTDIPVISDGSAAVTRKTFEVGQTTGTAQSLTQNSALADVESMYSGPPRVASGLELSCVAFSVAVAAGVAITQGVIVVEEPIIGVVVVDNTTNSIWLRQLAPDGTPEAVVSVDSPSPGAVYLGAVVIDDGDVTIDTSGVLYAAGALPRREVASSAAPTDEPGTQALLTKTGSGLYLWDGHVHYKLVRGGASGTVTLAKLTGGGTNGSLTIVEGIITTIVAPT